MKYFACLTIVFCNSLLFVPNESLEERVYVSSIDGKDVQHTSEKNRFIPIKKRGIPKNRLSGGTR